MTKDRLIVYVLFRHWRRCRDAQRKYGNTPESRDYYLAMRNEAMNCLEIARRILYGHPL